MSYFFLMPKKCPFYQILESEFSNNAFVTERKIGYRKGAREKWCTHPKINFPRKIASLGCKGVPKKCIIAPEESS